ncbi:MAG: hypothetical protein ACRCWM_09300 [Sarcina sp.]
MNFTEEMKKSEKLHKDLQKIANLQSPSTGLKIYFSFMFYWLCVGFAYLKFNNFGFIILGGIVALTLVLSSNTLKLHMLVSIAELLLLLHAFYAIFKIIFLVILKLFSFSKKAKVKYDNLAKEDKSAIKKVLFIVLKLIARIAIREIGSEISSDSSFVNPHEVNGYTRSDGTDVSGYFRDGDGNPLTNLTRENGGGYFRKK